MPAQPAGVVRERLRHIHRIRGFYGCRSGGLYDARQDDRLVTAWTFIWLMVILKIPIVGLYSDRALGGSPDARGSSERTAASAHGRCQTHRTRAIRATHAHGCRVRRAAARTETHRSRPPRACARSSRAAGSSSVDRRRGTAGSSSVDGSKEPLHSLRTSRATMCRIIE